MQIYSSFLHSFWQSLWKIRNIIFGLFTLLVVDAAVIAYFEKMPFADALYFTFVTGLTIGYGDIAPVTLIGRVVAILTGFQGMLMTGLITAVAVFALRKTMADSN
jgi:voltage-gated potassium channel